MYLDYKLMLLVLTLKSVTFSFLAAMSSSRSDGVTQSVRLFVCDLSFLLCLWSL